LFSQKVKKGGELPQRKKGTMRSQEKAAHLGEGGDNSHRRRSRNKSTKKEKKREKISRKKKVLEKRGRFFPKREGKRTRMKKENQKRKERKERSGVKRRGLPLSGNKGRGEPSSCRLLGKKKTPRGENAEERGHGIYRGKKKTTILS